MDLEQTVQDLRTRINRLRATLETNTPLKDPEPAQAVEQPKPSAADVYKAGLMNKRNNSNSNSSSS